MLLTTLPVSFAGRGGHEIYSNQWDWREAFPLKVNSNSLYFFLSASNVYRNGTSWPWGKHKRIIEKLSCIVITIPSNWINVSNCLPLDIAILEKVYTIICLSPSVVTCFLLLVVNTFLTDKVRDSIILNKFLNLSLNFLSKKWGMSYNSHVVIVGIKGGNGWKVLFHNVNNTVKTSFKKVVHFKLRALGRHILLLFSETYEFLGVSNSVIT